MDSNVLQQMVNRQPFVPFVLRMNDGREFRVANPAFITSAMMDVAILSIEEKAYYHLDPALIARLRYPVTDD